VNQPFGWLVPIAGAGMGLGSAAIALALARAGVPHRAGLVVWSVAMLVVAAFPADPAPRLGTVAWTPAGVVHVVAGAIAFFSLAVAAPLISRAVPSRAVRILGVAAPLGLLLFVITLVNRPPVARLIGEPVAHGLGERVMVAIYAAWLISVAWWVRRERS